jgi:hypothetical protein
MADAADPRTALRRGFAAGVRQLGLALELVAEDVLADEDEPIDWIAAAPDGRAWVVLLADGPAPAGMLERALVQRAWVEARVPDWQQLAPTLALRSGLAPGVLLVASDYDRGLRIAAREASGDGVLLARWSGDASEPALALIDVPPRPRRRPALPAPRLVSVFRTGLTDADLAG